MDNVKEVLEQYYGIEPLEQKTNTSLIVDIDIFNFNSEINPQPIFDVVNKMPGIYIDHAYGMASVRCYEGSRFVINDFRRKLHTLTEIADIPFNNLLLKRFIIDLDIDVTTEIEESINILNGISPLLYGEMAFEAMLNYSDNLYGHTSFTESKFNNSDFKITFYHPQLQQGTVNMSIIHCKIFASMLFQLRGTICANFLFVKDFWIYIYEDIKKQWVRMLGNDIKLMPVQTEVFKKIEEICP